MVIFSVDIKTVLNHSVWKPFAVPQMKPGRTLNCMNGYV